MKSKRTWQLEELRTVRDGLEAQYDTLRDMNLYSLPNARQALDDLKAVLKSLKQEIDYGENHCMADWNWAREDKKP